MHVFFSACSPVNPERHFSCEPCRFNVSGGFDHTANQVFIIQSLTIESFRGYLYTVFKIFIWGGISLDIQSEIQFYSNMQAEP